MRKLNESRWVRFLVVVLAVSVLVSVGGCGTLFNGSVSPENRGSVDGVALILDIIFWFPLGLIVDLITGGLWNEKEGAIPPSPGTP